MSGGSLWQSRVDCPFYKKDDQHEIVCEGVGEAEATILRYRLKQERNKQIRLFCAGCYEKCEVHRMIMASKYED